MNNQTEPGGEVVELDNFRQTPPEPHFNVLAMCIACSKRWIGTVVAKTSLFNLECPACAKQDSFASFIPADYLGEFA